MKPIALTTYQPTFVIDDGFRLTSEPTIEAVVNDVKRWFDFSLRGADAHLLGVFLTGVCLIRAKKMVKPAARGVHGMQGRYDGFDGWKRKTFGDQIERTLGRYMNFAGQVYARPKTDTVSVLGKSPQHFALPRTAEGIGELLAALGTVMDGKTMTEMYRSIKRIREALPPAKTGIGHRRTKAAIELERLRGEAATTLGHTTKTIDRWLGQKLYLHLDDPAVKQFRDQVGELHRALADLADARRIK